MFNYPNYPNIFYYCPQIYLQPTVMCYTNYPILQNPSKEYQFSTQIAQDKNIIQSLNQVKYEINTHISSKQELIQQEVRIKQLNLTRQDLLKHVNTVNRKLWSEQEDQLLKKVAIENQMDWKVIASHFPYRNANQCYGRYRRIIRDSKRRGWTKKQDQILKECVEKYGQSWKSFINNFENRTSKQIRQRYLNNLRPQITNEEWTVEQDLKICELIKKYGKKWKQFEQFLEGRSQNRIKNRYYGHIKKINAIKVKQIKYQNMRKQRKAALEQFQK